jgi:hypothetical protein
MTIETKATPPVTLNLTRLQAMDLLSKAWQFACDRPKDRKRYIAVFKTIQTIRKAGWCVYWNNWVEPYMP